MVIYIFIFISIIAFRLIFQKKYFSPVLVSQSSLNGKKQQKTINAFWIATFFVLFIFTGFRGGTVGIDVPEYLRWFKEFNNIGWERTFKIKKDVELGYLYINYFVSKFSQNPHYLIIVVSFLILVLHLTFLRIASTNFFLSLMLYLSFNHFFTSMSSWRQFLAMGIVFFLYPLLIKKKYFLAFLVMIVGFFFHFSTLLFDIAIIIAYLFSRKKKWIVYFLFFCILSPPIFEKIFFSIIGSLPKYAFYAKTQANGVVGKLRYVYILIEIFLVLYVTINKKLKKRNINLMCILLCFSILVGLLGASVPLIFRLGYYFEYFLILLIPEIICLQKKKMIVYLDIFVISFGFLFYLYLMITNSAGMIPWYMY